VSFLFPCYNEEASDLKRTIKTLKAQLLPEDVVVEVLVAMDGTEQMASSMRAYITELFGIATEKNGKNNPFIMMPKANTVIVEPEADKSRVRFSLVIKRTNRRKVNSQMWWLRSHAKEIQCEFALGTDCGIIFEKKNLSMMLERLDSDRSLSAVTGYLRVMSSAMQGDGPMELCTDPLGWFLRQLQSYDIEVRTLSRLKYKICSRRNFSHPFSIMILMLYYQLSQSTTKSAADTIGFLPVLPGPCSLYRFKHLAGVMHEYFSLTTQKLDTDNSGIILGNVQLAEDRFPPVLLTFRDEDDCKDAGISKPRTGFLRDAVFYFEAEKPLSQFVKQRRRWINGAFIAVYWVLQESWISNSDHGFLTKAGSKFLLCIELLQGAIVRLVVPATIACALSFMVTILPSIIDGDEEGVQNVLNFEEIEGSQFGLGALAAAGYLFLYSYFVLAHTPRAVKVQRMGVVTWESDRHSAYHPLLFFLGFIVNAWVVVLFLYVAINVYLTVGWSGSPKYFRLLTAFSMLPYAVAFVDGLVNSSRPSIRSFVTLLLTTPVFYLGSLWFYVWFPAYASARISDLSWGNRAGINDIDGDLRRRAEVGRNVSILLVTSNLFTATLVLSLVHVITGFLDFVFFTLLAFNILLHVVNLLDMILRLMGGIVSCIVGELPPQGEEEYIPKKRTAGLRGGDESTVDESFSE
jgi:cellulose synthase/poly-beta-1,6-N-acetylglucosamine synthase-like glycosyltransferase